MEIVLDAGAIDMRSEEEYYEILVPFSMFEEVKQALEQNKISYSNAELTMLPQTNVKLEGKEAEHMLKLMQALEEHEDVQKVYANFDISEELMEKISVQSQ
jgi:transcriptional/translational regulatory protein YebC/TACO1